MTPLDAQKLYEQKTNATSEGPAEVQYGESHKPVGLLHASLPGWLNSVLINFNELAPQGCSNRALQQKNKLTWIPLQHNPMLDINVN